MPSNNPQAGTSAAHFTDPETETQGRNVLKAAQLARGRARVARRSVWLQSCALNFAAFGLFPSKD